MRRLALIVPLAFLLSSCASFSWEKAPKEIAPGEIDVEALVAVDLMDAKIATSLKQCVLVFHPERGAGHQDDRYR